MKFKDVIDKAFDVAVILSILAGVAVLISIIIHVNQLSRDSRGVCAGVIVITEQQLENCKELELPLDKVIKKSEFLEFQLGCNGCTCNNVQ